MSMKLTAHILGVLFLLPAAVFGQNRSITGTVVDGANGEALPGVVVAWESASKKTSIATNTYGMFSLSVPAEAGTVKVQLLGYATYSQAVKAGKEAVKLSVRLNEVAFELGEVAVQSQKLDNNVKTTEMSVSSLTSKEIKKIPQLLGETDIVRTLTLLPGVSTVGEASSGFNVRGGNADQNLILLDEAPVYSSSHLFGFFSIFNADAVRDVTLFKGGMPANYGGRLSSVLDVRQKEGNSERYAAQGGIGLLSSRLTVEGPLVKQKASFMVSGRRSYFDLFLPYT
ncbi:MAG: TonB-dependent receptor, partial [Schleiferiaceae bacterium]